VLHSYLINFKCIITTFAVLIPPITADAVYVITNGKLNTVKVEYESIIYS